MTPKPKATDWDLYYRKDPLLSHITRPIIENTVMKAFRKYSIQRPVLVELGGAGSRVYESVMRTVSPTEYHVVDSNRYGLELMSNRINRPDLFIHEQNVLNLDLDLQADTVFSLGLIEHFNEEGTRNAVLSHFRLLKLGGIAIISYPTPTPMYRASRGLAEMAGKWIFHDERPLRTPEVAQAMAGRGEIIFEALIWQIFLTQTLIVARKVAV